jgi:hypothetical protein
VVHKVAGDELVDRVNPVLALELLHESADDCLVRFLVRALHATSSLSPRFGESFVTVASYLGRPAAGCKDTAGIA